MGRSFAGKMLAAALLGTVLASPAARADYPEQPIKIVVPYGAGGFVDSMARIFTDKLGSVLGKPVVVENRGGAGGKLGEDAVLGAAPDGYTLLISFVTRPTLAAATSPPGTPDTDMLKAFTVIAPLGTSPILMTASPSLGVKDFAGLIAKVKAEPGKYSYGSPGPGSESQIVSAQIVNRFGLEVVHVPYRGGAAALTDVAAGVLAWMVNTPSGSLPLIEGGKVVPLFVINPTRIKQLPDTPTTQELGITDLKDEVTSIFLAAPVGTPRPVLERLNAAINEIQKDPAVAARLATLAFVAPAPDTSLEAARALAAAQIDAWATAVKSVSRP
jgi:tripartite-type tricarboxylate transporter receptor subunit TctC